MTKISVSKNIVALRQAAQTAIDAEAELARTRPDRLTPGDGQQQEYSATLTEAKAFQSDPAPQDADYPMLAADRNAYQESGVNPNATLATVAAEVLQQAGAWSAPLGAAIKQARLKGKRKIDLATTPAQVDLERDAAVNELRAI